MTEKLNFSTVQSKAAPIYSDIKTYNIWGGNLVIWEGDGWKPESMSWKNGCYIHTGLSGNGEITLRGPDAQKALSNVSINDCYKWPIGYSKHLVMCDEEGLVLNHGLVIRDSEDSFRSFASLPWPAMALAMSGVMKFEISLRDIFLHQIAGPTSLTVLERVTGESLRDVKFLQTRPTRIPGIDAEIEISRIGMAGTLAYELRGPIEAGPDVFDAVFQAGQDLGIKRLGWRTYPVNHTEGGFPQGTCSFMSSLLNDPSYLNSPFGAGMSSAFDMYPVSGSIDPADLRARYRTVGEVGWSWMAKFNHEFTGRKAVEAEVANPKRTIVTLRWNTEDVIDIYASQFRPGEEYKFMEFPCAPQAPAGFHADHVTKDGKKIGISSSTVYSYYFREVISECTIDCDQAHVGNEVIVHWGDFGGRIKEVRATVAKFPLLDLPRNQDYDLSTVPSGVPEG